MTGRARLSHPGKTIVISTDRGDIDRDRLHRFLSKDAYWAKGIPRGVMDRSIDNSMCFAALDGKEMVGFARVVTDKAVFAYLADVYVEPDHRGAGISKALMRALMEHPDLQGLRRFMLATADAHGLYRQFGFEALNAPEKLMQIHNPDVYTGP